ncbi:hypothetical protein NL350_27810, partial [Klebsiella pneumoniae]|nr:hypothetical protein [Klebsiella pneumoniae]
EEDLELGAVGFEEEEKGGEGPGLRLVGVGTWHVGPVGARHGNGGGGEKEEVVEVFEEGEVGVELEDAIVRGEFEGA